MLSSNYERQLAVDDSKLFTEKCQSISNFPKIFDPQISVFRIREHHDFVLLLSSSILANLSASELMTRLNHQMQSQDNRHAKCGAVVDEILAIAASAWPLENLTCVCIAFPSFAHKLDTSQATQTVDSLVSQGVQLKHK